MGIASALMESGRKAAMNKTTKDVMFSSKSDEWSTPIEIYEKLDLEFHFDLDPCATAGNHKCSKYYTTDQDGLIQNWGGAESFVTHHIQESENG